MAGREETGGAGGGPGGGPADLDSVRSELRRLGYLSHRFDRFLLQDALGPRRPWRSLVGLAVKVGLLAGSALALALAFALAAANGNLAASPLDLFPLFVHLLVPAAAAVGLSFLLLCAVIALVLRLSHVRRIEALSLAAALAAGAAALGLGVWRLRDLVGETEPWPLAVLAVAAPAAVYVLVRLVYRGLLALAIRLTDHAPHSRIFARRWPGAVLAAAFFLLFLPAVLAVGGTRPGPPPSLPTAPGDRVLLVGVDGVLASELDYLLAQGELPTLERLLAAGGGDEDNGGEDGGEGDGGETNQVGETGSGRLLTYRRPAVPPAVLWTSVATGRPAPEHGLDALDSFRPLGVRTPLGRSGPLRTYWSRVAEPLGLAEHRPVLSNRRRAFTVWELAARGGVPVLAVNWWGTFPAESLPGLVVAHGAYQLLAEGAPAAVAPAAELDGIAALAASVAMATPEPPAALAPVRRSAIDPDRFYRRVAAAYDDSLQPRATAIYLPAPDIAALGWRGGTVAFGDLVRDELAAADRLIGRWLEGEGPRTLVVVIDPGRRQGEEGRMLLWRSSGCGEPATGDGAVGDEAGASAAWPPVIPEAAASALLRALGLPQSEELPEPPAVCAWPSPPARIAGYGERREPSGVVAGGDAAGEEYLDSLRSLGYL